MKPIKRIRLIKAAALFSALLPAMALAGVAEEEVIFENDFNAADALAGWRHGPECTPQADGGRGGSGGLLFVATDEKASLTGITLAQEPAMVNLTLAEQNAKPAAPLALESLRGRAVQIEAWFKGEDISKPLRFYLGPKLMLVTVDAVGKIRYLDQPKVIGSYDWRKFTVFARIPDSAVSVSLNIGLQGCTGKLWVDDLKVTLVPALAVSPDGLEGQLPAQKETKFRGVMSGKDLSAEAFRELREVWNANLIRFQIGRRWGEDNTSEEKYRGIVERNLRRLDEILPLARQYDIKILIDMHVGPGTRIDELQSNSLSWEPEMQRILADVWREIALKYKDEPAIWGYDLLNEPVEDSYVYTPDGGLDWHRLAEKLARTIREVDPETPIIIEPASTGTAGGFQFLHPINVPKVIYSFHIYNPTEFTHQGVGRPRGVVYPGKAEGREWNKDALEGVLAPVIAFQKKYNVPIYVGEFGVARWAPGAEQWLDDAISLFEKYGWDWTYHAFREYQGWDAEIGPDFDDQTRIGDTPRRQVLLKYMKRNGN